MSIHFIKYENLHSILNLVEKESDCKDKTAIVKMVNDEIYKRDNKLLERVELKDGKEIWVKPRK